MGPLAKSSTLAMCVGASTVIGVPALGPLRMVRSG